MDPTKIFAELARGFCNWCENAQPAAQRDSQAVSWLCRLYAAALDLPETGPENSDDGPDIPEHLLERAKTNLAPFNGWYYREYFDPDPGLNDESGLGDIGDDLLDTYKDIHAGLLLFEQGQLANALWHWAFCHRNHWGRHAAGAIHALHGLSISRQGPM
ncbi:MAG: DUF5063 domain-containing protein [Pseudomonadota bacterium]